ncbi:MAG: hypothetical protein JWP97_4613 [Labilithrix sp.]|nr:hypothetical protein [Labilithrix sp.]
MVSRMPAASSTFSQIRFAPVAPVEPAGPAQPAVHPGAGAAPPFLDMPRVHGLALLEHLGLGRPDFGAIAARELAPRCRRGLWEVARNADPALRQRTARLLAVAEVAGEGMVLFG